VLGFTAVQDTRLAGVQRWVLVTPPRTADDGATLLLARAATRG
jgi:hypothetical protein